MAKNIPHSNEESPARELAIVARFVIDTQKETINESRKADPDFAPFLLDKFEPDVADFERAFLPYLERIRLKERLDVLKKYERFGMIGEVVEITQKLNNLNMRIAMIEHPDVT